MLKSFPLLCFWMIPSQRAILKGRWITHIWTREYIPTRPPRNYSLDQLQLADNTVLAHCDTSSNHFTFYILSYLSWGGAGSTSLTTPPPPLPVNLFYHINLNNPINLIFSDFKFCRFLNILAEFWRFSTCQFGARTFLSKFFSDFFVLWSLIVFLSFSCLYLALYYSKVVCTQFFIPRLIISFKNLFVFQ